MKSSRISLYNLSSPIRSDISAIGSEKTSDDLQELVNPGTETIQILLENSLLHFACSMCEMDFQTLEEQKAHYKSDRHVSKLRESLKRRDGGDESTSSSESEEEEEEDDGSPEVEENGCLITFSLPSARITLYKRLVESGFTNRAVNSSQLSSHIHGHFCVILYRSGYFILGIYDKGKLLLSRHDKRYTTRRKQGGAQRKKDNSSGKAISMGARLRRHNEELMQEFVVKTLQDLHEEINKCSAIFLGTTKLNTSLFFREGCLRKEDPRVRKVPLFFRRPNLTEMNRVYKELVTVTVNISSDDECKERRETCCIADEQKGAEQLSASERVSEQQIEEEKRAQKESGEEDIQMSAELDVICRTDSLNCFWTSILTHDFPMIQALLLERPHYAYVWDEDGESALHYAAKSNSIELISTLLECGCDPTMQDEQGRVAFSLASSKEAHKVFQDYRAAHPDQWNYTESGIPSPLSAEQLEKKREKQRQRQRQKRQRQKERKEAAKEAAKEDIKEKAKETPKEAPKPEEMTKADIKQVNDKFSSKKLSAMEQLRLTNRLHKLASRLQITYHDLVSYLSRDGNSISERADYIESVLDSGAIPVEVILEDMFGF